MTTKGPGRKQPPTAREREINEGTFYHREGRVKRSTQDSVAPRGGRQRGVVTTLWPAGARGGPCFQNPWRAGVVRAGCPTGAVVAVGMKPKPQQGRRGAEVSQPSSLPPSDLLNHTRIWREREPTWGSLQRSASRMQVGQRTGREHKQVITRRTRESVPGVHQATARDRE